MRELAIQVITAFVGGMVAVVFANFVLNLARYVRDRDFWL
jgi:hypothetical protein